MPKYWTIDCSKMQHLGINGPLLHTKIPFLKKFLIHFIIDLLEWSLDPKWVKFVLFYQKRFTLLIIFKQFNLFTLTLTSKRS